MVKLDSRGSSLLAVVPQLGYQGDTTRIPFHSLYGVVSSPEKNRDEIRGIPDEILLKNSLKECTHRREF